MAVNSKSVLVQVTFVLAIIIIAMAALTELYFYDLLGIAIITNVPVSAGVLGGSFVIIVLGVFGADKLWR